MQKKNYFRNLYYLSRILTGILA